MEATPTAMLKLLLPKTPFILKTALAHTLSLSETSSKWDLRTELTIRILRSMLGPDSKTSSISKAQHLTTKDPGIKGKMWISKVAFSVPDSDDDAIRKLVFKAVDDMCSTDAERAAYNKPLLSQPLEAEWTGYRAGAASPNEPEPANLSELDKYNNLVAETSTKVTTLYFHGGAMYLLDPATYRNMTSRLAKETGGRVLSVRYRLSPQHPFPAALLDAFVAYLGLLYPPEGSPHAPVPASEIIFAGDSAGGLLCTALLQLLLQIHRSHNPTSAPSNTAASLPTVHWHGAPVALPLPAGAALMSPWLDITRSLPSIEDLAKYDYLPPPSATARLRFPPCAAWPASPPRAELYAADALLVHPLVSTLMARDWRGAPPVFISLGQEMLRDEGAVLAKRMHGQGVKVVWREFEVMPHVFAMMLEGLEVSNLHHDMLAGFCKDVVGGAQERGGDGEGQSDAEFILAKSLKREKVALSDVTALTDEEVEKLCRQGMENIIKRHGEAATDARPML